MAAVAMTPRVPVGDLVDHDMRLYQFARTSGLPRGYFRQRWRPKAWVLLILAVAATTVLLLN